MQIQILVHEAFEGPGAILEWAQSRGLAVAVSALYDNDPLPKAGEAELLVVMGGPQSPDTQDCPYFDSQAEQQLICDTLAQGKGVLGVCLGAQLIGAALGARHQASPEPEIGVYPIVLTGPDPLLAGFPKELLVGHWHQDMPGLPEGAKVLAQSAGCPRQIVRFADKAWGFQCHLELNPGLVEGLLAQGPLPQGPYVMAPETFLAQDFTEMNGLLLRFLDGFASQLGLG